MSLALAGGAFAKTGESMTDIPSDDTAGVAKSLSMRKKSLT
jgi:hypothetical protein